jgi:hypothetical protein
MTMATGLGFDPALPELAVAFDDADLARRFAPAGGAVRSLRRQDVKYQPARRLAATYELTVEAPGQRPQPTIGVLEITPAGASTRLLGVDAALPGLVEALDPGAMLARLNEALGGQADTCVVVPVRYKPGSRCVIRYELGGQRRPPADNIAAPASTLGRRTVYAKLLAGGCEQLVAALAALGEAAATDPAMPGIVPVVAHWPELWLVVQPAVAGAVELNDAGFDPGVPEAVRAGWLRRAGQALAAYQRHQLPGIPSRPLGGDLDDLRSLVAPMTKLEPALATRFETVVDRLAQVAAAQPVRAEVGGHGAFRTDQFLLQNEHLVMIDLDSVCQAEPERDVGNFLAYLDWKVIRRPESGGVVATAEAAFLDGYSAATAPDAERVATYRAASLLKVAGRRFRSLTLGELHLVPRLVDDAEALLGAAA